MKSEKIYQLVLSGGKNISFMDFVKLLETFGFVLDRISGSHHIYKHSGVKELINIQNVKGKVKPYQIKQFLTIVETYNLEMRKEK
jgi:predicted RNA binding protein YcfA (HicA-like mRNA interferase family)